MSRGPGKWQRAILDELQRREACYVREVSPAPKTRSDHLAAVRAAHQLARKGLVVVDVEQQHWKRGAWGAVVVARPGVAIDHLTLAALARRRAEGEISDSSIEDEPLSLTTHTAAVLDAYRQLEAADRGLRTAQRASKAARQEGARAAFEEMVAQRVYEAVQQHIERELHERLARELATEAAGVEAQAKAAVQGQLTADRRDVGAAVRFLMNRGELITETALVAVLEEVLRWPKIAAEAAVARLQASGDYQRLVHEATHGPPPEA
jgi:hypothetical protein